MATEPKTAEPYQRTEQYKWLREYNAYKYPNGTPSHIDQNVVFDELMRSTGTTPPEHAVWENWSERVAPDLSCYYDDIGAVVLWDRVRNMDGTLQKVPGIGSPEVAYALRVLGFAHLGSLEHPGDDDNWPELGLDFILEEPTSCEMPKFWEGAKFYSERWRRKHMNPHSVAEKARRYAIDSDLNRTFRRKEIPAPDMKLVIKLPVATVEALGTLGYTVESSLEQLEILRVLRKLTTTALSEKETGKTLESRLEEAQGALAELRAQIEEEKKKRQEVEQTLALARSEKAHTETMFAREWERRREAETQLDEISTEHAEQAAALGVTTAGFQILTEVAKSNPEYLPKIMRISQQVPKEALESLLQLDLDIILAFLSKPELTAEITDLAKRDVEKLKLFVSNDRDFIKRMSNASLGTLRWFLNRLQGEIPRDRSQSMTRAHERGRARQRENVKTEE
ncbi:hypothetical protein QBC47DRAFT_410329 [Echria macrotheca]|uniref:Uncharacterized protein n=1 Tax=Echria macrotheca TaxID=438768 RepID=A0AAJ0F8X8_9PEZI|nr:hypothetical protein QBC47DRAFT_410329 [Echria macrotheca]